MFDFVLKNNIFMILGGVIIFLFVFYIILAMTSKNQENKTTKPTINTTTPSTLPSNNCKQNSDCSGNKICLDGNCQCFMYKGDECIEPIFSYNALKNYELQLNEQNVTDESINSIFNEINRYIPGNYKNKDDLLKIISNLQSLTDNTLDKSKKIDIINSINSTRKEKCPESQVSCNKNCIDINNSTENCGGCDKKCPDTQICVGGECQCPENSVWYSADGTNYICVNNTNGDYILCGDKYYDKNNNQEHCGTCENKCRGDQKCSKDGCICTDTNRTECRGNCVDIKNDPENCGDCDGKCKGGQNCVGGTCQCPENSVWYRTNVGEDYKCVDNSRGNYKEFDGIYYNILTSSERCGKDGIRCSPEHSCKDGICLCNDPSKTDCNGICINVKGKDIENCGKCDDKCGNNQKCDSGFCICADGFINCNGTCIQLSTNENCEGCNKKCTGGQNCVSGTCQCPENSVWYRTNVGEDYKCVDNSRGNYKQFDGVYYDTLTSSERCGKDGKKCGTNEICNTGNCVCNDLSILCDGKCVRTSLDPNNCGSCGKKCGDGQRCLGSTCQCSDTTKINCNGKCVDTKIDSNNCGSCGKKCTNGTICFTSQDPIIPSQPGQPKPPIFKWKRRPYCECQNGRLGDMNNCGTCGIKCDSDTQNCIGGKCVCKDPTKSNCNGTCVDTKTDSNNCGACDQIVPSNTKCVGGKPVGDPATNYVFCSATWPVENPQNFVKNITNDNSNCGACNQIVPSNTKCVGGKPVGEPVENYAFCSVTWPVENPQNFVKNIKNDPNNCGKCGNNCKDYETCCNGTCILACNKQCEIPCKKIQEKCVVGTSITCNCAPGFFRDNYQKCKVIPAANLAYRLFGGVNQTISPLIFDYLGKDQNTNPLDIAGGWIDTTWPFYGNYCYIILVALPGVNIKVNISSGEFSDATSSSAGILGQKITANGCSYIMLSTKGEGNTINFIVDVTSYKYNENNLGQTPISSNNKKISFNYSTGPGKIISNTNENFKTYPYGRNDANIASTKNLTPAMVYFGRSLYESEK